jgi:hypothetical protein
MMSLDAALDDVQHQLNILVSARQLAALSPTDEALYQELCEVERSLVATVRKAS